MIGNVLRFRIKRTLVGVAALSLLVPMASHADVTPGRWIFDGFTRSTRDGKGATCVGSGGETHAFDAPGCTDASSSAKAAAEAAAKARKAAEEAAAAKKAAAAAEAKEFLPGGQRDFRVRRNDGIKLLDGFGRDCVKNGSPVSGSSGNCADPTPQSARGVDSIISARAAAKKEAQAASAAAAAAAKALPMAPGAALTEGQKGAYVYHPAGSNVRDGYGRSCVKDGLWHPALATEDCHPDLYNEWQAKTARPEQDLVKRVQLPPPEVERPAEVSAAAAPAEPVAPVVAAPPAAAAAAAAVEAPAEFPVTKYSIEDAAEAAALPTVAALAADVENDDEDDDQDAVAETDDASDDNDDTPVAAAAADDADADADATDGDPVALMDAEADDVEDDDSTPDEPEDDDDSTMPFLAGDMRDEDDTALALEDDGVPDGDDDALLDEDAAPSPAFVAANDDEDEEDDDSAASEDVEDDVEAVYLADADPVEEGETSSALAMMTDDDEDEEPVFASEEDDDDDAPVAVFAEEPAVANVTEVPPAPVVPESPKVIAAAATDNKQAEFPVTRYEVEGSTAEPVKAADPVAPPPATPAANAECPPTTIQMEEGRFSFDRYTLRPAVVAKLDAIAELLKTAKCDAIVITGHTDRIGTTKYNQRLSERRAMAAKNYLVNRKGIDESLISVAGMGKTEPVTAIADCKGKRKKALIACYAPDRRVVITATARKN